LIDTIIKIDYETNKQPTKIGLSPSKLIFLVGKLKMINNTPKWHLNTNKCLTNRS
jgi:hypothetical protein